MRRTTAALVLCLCVCQESPLDFDRGPTRGSPKAHTWIRAGERATVVGEVIERVELAPYTYMRVRLTLGSTGTEHVVGREICVAVTGEGPPVGETVRARSLGRRSRVWIRVAPV